jgi:mannose-6-phosphate isomerase-like protein (cupin superfamily)
MFRRGEIYDNPVTGIRAIVRLGTDESNGQKLVIDLYVRGCSTGTPKHLHPTMQERLTVVSGCVAVFLNGTIFIARPGDTFDIPPGTPHRWWNADFFEAKVTMEISPADRFEVFIRNMIGLAQDGKTDAKGMPNLLQLALLADEFDDVIHFLEPPRFVQRVLFPLLALVARMRGYKSNYPEYLFRPSSKVPGNTNKLKLISLL